MHCSSHTNTTTDMGYAYGYLLSSEIKESYQYMLSWILKKFTVCVGGACVWAWVCKVPLSPCSSYNLS